MVHSATPHTHRVSDEPVVADSRFSVITKRAIIRSVPAAFERQYGYDRNGTSWKGTTTRGEIIDALKSLDVETCPADAVNEIIGNKSWTENKCDGCYTDCETLIRFGEEPDYEARWQDLCAQCLTDAARVATTASSVGMSAANAPNRPTQDAGRKDGGAGSEGSEAS